MKQKREKKLSSPIDGKVNIYLKFFNYEQHFITGSQFLKIENIIIRKKENCRFIS